MVEDAGLLGSMKLALIFLLDMSTISSQGKWVGRRGRSSHSYPPSLPTALRPRKQDGTQAAAGAAPSLPPSAWLESQTAPRRKREGSETHPIFSCLGSKT